MCIYIYNIRIFHIVRRFSFYIAYIDIHKLDTRGEPAWLSTNFQVKIISLSTSSKCSQLGSAAPPWRFSMDIECVYCMCISMNVSIYVYNYNIDY